MSNPRTILIVDDNALVAKFFRMSLERAGGFSCVVTENVPEMVAKVRDGLIDLAVLDVSLSDSMWEGRPVDGLELSRLLKKHSPKPLPVVLATAHAMAGDRERFLAASGAEDYLEKPVYDAVLLVEKVRRLLGD